MLSFSTQDASLNLTKLVAQQISVFWMVAQITVYNRSVFLNCCTDQRTW
jgi:hypothetical protein